MHQDEFQQLFIDLDHECFHGRVVRAGWYAYLRDLRPGIKIVRNAWGDRRKLRIEKEGHLAGRMAPDEGLILVDPHRQLSQIRLTLLHEMVHADLWLQHPNDDEDHGPRFTRELRRLAQACRAGAKWPMLDRAAAAWLYREARFYEEEEDRRAAVRRLRALEIEPFV